VKRITDGFLTLYLIVAAAAVCAAQAAPDPPSDDAGAQQRRLLVEGRRAVEAGRPQEAISDYFDKVIDQFRATFGNSAKLVYCAQSQAEALTYATMGVTQARETVVLDSTWADAYLLKSYALMELGRVDEARAAIEAAVALGPQNAQYLTEFGYGYQVEKNWEKAIEVFRHAGEAAELSPDETKNADFGRAWRGEAYALVELGRLGEAEALYRKCLALDGTDKKAQNELVYLEDLRKQATKSRPR
jgi:Flp pilus assembly protein TadD